MRPKIEIKRIEWMVAVILSFLVLFLLVTRTAYTGGLWRDEAGSVQLAQMPGWTEILANYAHDSFPLLFVAVLRSYAAIFGAGDASLRLFGLAVGVSLLVVAWFNSRVVSRDAPLLFPALIGLNTTFLTTGTSVRAYGLGSVLIVLAFGLTAKVLVSRQLRWFVLAFFACLAGMHCLYFDAALVGAITLAAILVCTVRRELGWAMSFAGTGILCGISYIPYLLRYSSSRDWMVILTFPQDFSAVGHELLVLCGAPISIMAFVWSSALFVTFVGALWQIGIIWRTKPAPELDLLLFACVTSLAAVAGCFGFLRLLNVQLPESRYYLAAFCLLAASLDLIVANLTRFDRVRIARLALVTIGMITLSIADLLHVMERATNLDLVAERLNRDVTPAELIIVNPWWYGVSFNRYYHGAARWMTVPEMSDHRTHRYDLMKAKMIEPDPLADLRRAIFETLDSGNRVWLVGGALPPPEPGKPLRPPPPPDPQYGWNNEFYSCAWSMQLGEFLLQHVVNGGIVMQPGDDVNNEEKITLLFAEGWQN